MALNYQEKSHEMIKTLIPEDSQYVRQSEQQLHQYMHQSVMQEKQKNFEKNSQGIGSGKRAIGENKPKMTELDKTELQ